MHMKADDDDDVQKKSYVRFDVNIQGLRSKYVTTLHQNYRILYTVFYDYIYQFLASAGFIAMTPI
jgi:hypothetical protein